MSRLAIAFVLALTSVAANAQDTKPEHAQTPAVHSADGTRPFLFDGRMRDDDARQKTVANGNHPNGWGHRHAAESKPA
jgi:hypothetical protein